MQISFGKIGFSFFVNTVFFAVTLLVFFPVFNSGDDVFVLYQLAGGFGEAPTNLLHYNHLMHPWIGWVIKSLFAVAGSINWYAWLLYLVQFLSGIVILIVLLGSISRREALLWYSLLFAVCISRFIIQPSFSNTSLMAGTSGLALLLYLLRKQASWLQLLFCAGWICFAAMIRFYVLIPLLAVAAPWFLWLPLRSKLKGLACLLSAAALFFLLNWQQVRYYEQYIPNWRQTEQYRQAAFNFYNRPVQASGPLLPYATEKNMVQSGLFIDTSFLSVKKLALLSATYNHTRRFSDRPVFDTLYWNGKENRLFLFALLLIIASVLPAICRKTVASLLLSALMLIAIMAFLVLWQKLPFYLVTGLPLIIPLLLLLSIRNADVTAYSRTAYQLVVATGLIACFFWAGIRLHAISSKNQENNAGFRCSYQDIAGHPDKLFIVTDDLFPLDYFSVFDSPRQFPIRNLLTKDILLNHIEQPVFRRFGIQYLPGDLLHNKNILLTGSNPLAVFDYYKSQGVAVAAVDPQIKCSCIQATGITAR